MKNLNANLTRAEKLEYLALLEERRKREPKHSLHAFCRTIEIPGAPINDEDDCEDFYVDVVTPAEHHDLLNSALEKVESGEIPNLMVFMPPGSAKSTYASVTFPSWYMGKRPRDNVICASYASDLAKKFGRKCRQICKSAKYNEIFDTGIVADNKAADDWSLTNGSAYMSGGILSGITGNRADLLVIDDPVKGRQAADSPAVQESTWEAYKSDLRTRMKPNGRKVIIQTRWNEKDLSGRILPEDWDGESGWVTSQQGEQWYVICLSAECDRPNDPLGRKIGEYLWTDWFSVEHWETEKRNQGSRNWNALYQQRPAPDDGDYYKREDFRYYDKAPKHLNIYMSGDFAVSDDDQADFTELAVWGVDPNDDIYVLDWVQAQDNPDSWIDDFISLVKLYKPIWFVGETGVIRQAVESTIKKEMRKKKAFTKLEWLPHNKGNKPAMGRSFQRLQQANIIHLPKNKGWADDLEDQLIKFPAGRFDDKADACALFGRKIDEIWAAPKPKEEKKPQPITDQPLRMADFEPGRKQDLW